jgi:hypothetical protein
MIPGARPLVAVLLAAAACAAGCARHERLSTNERRVPGAEAYDGVLAECVRHALHPERGGG